MKKKRAIIISFNNHGYYSLAIHYLKLYAEKDIYLKSRCKIYTVEYEINQNNVSILNNLNKLQPDLIAFSCYTWNIDKILSIAKIIKQMLPFSKIVVGGQEVTNSAIDYMAANPYLDILVDGTGEIIFKNLLYSMVEDDFKSLKTVKGIQYRDKDIVHKNPLEKRFIKLDDIPSPYLEGNAKIPKNSGLGVMVDHVRGCPKKCTFCFEGMRCDSMDSFSLGRIREELAWAKSKGYSYFHILDPVLCRNDIDLLQGMRKIFKDVFYKTDYTVSVEIYAEHIDQNNIIYFDCYHIFDIGLQTISTLSNRLINRKLNLNKFTTGFEFLRKLNKHINVYLIYGLPGDNYETYINSVCFVDDIRPSAILLNKLCVLNGTILRHEAIQNDLIFESKPPYEIISNKTFSCKDIIKSEMFSHAFMRFYNKKCCSVIA